MKGLVYLYQYTQSNIPAKPFSASSFLDFVKSYYLSDVASYQALRQTLFNQTESKNGSGLKLKTEPQTHLTELEELIAAAS